MKWDDKRNDELRRMWDAGWHVDMISEALQTSRGRVQQQRAKLGLTPRKRGRKRVNDGSSKRHYPSGGSLKRHKAVKPGGNGKVLAPNHPAIANARTLFPSTVVDAAQSPRVLTSGEHQRKIGRKVVKGRWKGMPIYCLTLEERATCPRSCEVWHECYGNNMHFARRHRPSAEFEHRLIDELLELQKLHRGGFVVRLHILGDFYSVDYVELWHGLTQLIPELHVFGFTARQPKSDIGRAILRWLEWSNEETDARVWIRFSGFAAHGLGSLVIDNYEASEHVVCPAQTGATDCCGTCGLCWTMDRPIEFVRH